MCKLSYAKLEQCTQHNAQTSFFRLPPVLRDEILGLAMTIDSRTVFTGVKIARESFVPGARLIETTRPRLCFPCKQMYKECLALVGGGLLPNGRLEIFGTCTQVWTVRDTSELSIVEKVEDCHFLFDSQLELDLELFKKLLVELALAKRYPQPSRFNVLGVWSWIQRPMAFVAWVSVGRCLVLTVLWQHEAIKGDRLLASGSLPPQSFCVLYLSEYVCAAADGVKSIFNPIHTGLRHGRVPPLRCSYVNAGDAECKVPQWLAESIIKIGEASSSVEAHTRS